MMRQILIMVGLGAYLLACQTVNDQARLSRQQTSGSIAQKIADRDFPSVFQAWYGIDMPEYPQNTLEQRLLAASKHDLLWEEPLSQLGEGVELVLGLVWDHAHHGLADHFTASSLDAARANRQRLLELNPNMVFLLEVRWRDAPASFLPADSDWWLRNDKGEITKGWLGGWEPFYMLNYENEAFQDNVARQAQIALESGIYDGIMLDWSGHLGIIRKVREAIGDDGLIIVNIHDDIADGQRYQPYINGSFMELNPEDESPNPGSNLRRWETIRQALLFFENNLREPRINCLEVWGDRQDLSRMRALTTLGLTHSNAYVLYADPNPLKTPDHLHDWYAFWDTALGRPLAPKEDRPDGAYQRAFQGGTVVYNPYGNDTVQVRFETEMRRLSDGQAGREFRLPGRDGDIFIQP